MPEQYRAEVTPSSAIPTRDPREPWNPAKARSAVKRVVAERAGAVDTVCDEGALSDALLVASELTTNAMLHGGGVTDFDVTLAGHDLRLSVSDRNPRLPVALKSADDRGRRRCGGYGWPIVCRLSRDVRVSDLPAGGKRITAVVPLVPEGLVPEA